MFASLVFLPHWGSPTEIQHCVHMLELAGWCLLALLGLAEVVALVEKWKSIRRKAEIIGVASFALYVVVLLIETRYQSRSDELSSAEEGRLRTLIAQEESARQDLAQMVGGVAATTQALQARQMAHDRSRRLDPGQIRSITKALQTVGRGHMAIQFLRTGQNEFDRESREFAQQLRGILESAGWTVEFNSMSPFRVWIGTSITKPSDREQTLDAQILYRALKEAGVDIYYNETGLPIDDRPMLLIGKKSP